MLNNIRLAGLSLLLLLCTSCLKDDVDECPPGNVRLHFYAEKFRNKFEDPLADREAKFCDVMKHIRYYLYKDGALYRQEIIPNFDDMDINCYTLTLGDLEYGDYRIIVVGNSTRTALSGDPSDPANLVIAYPGFADTEDYFTTSYFFTVADEGMKEYDVGMSRVHGVIRYTFRNMPEDVFAFEVAMENVASQRWVTSDYREKARAFHQFSFIKPVGRNILTRQEMTTEDFVIGTFPTLPNQKSAYYLSLYREGATEPYLMEMISDTLSVTRNQLLDITTIFENGEIRFEVNMDSKWSGSISNGGTELD